MYLVEGCASGMILAIATDLAQQKRRVEGVFLNIMYVRRYWASIPLLLGMSTLGLACSSQNAPLDSNSEGQAAQARLLRGVRVKTSATLQPVFIHALNRTAPKEAITFSAEFAVGEAPQQDQYTGGVAVPQNETSKEDANINKVTEGQCRKFRTSAIEEIVVKVIHGVQKRFQRACDSSCAEDFDGGSVCNNRRFDCLKECRVATENALSRVEKGMLEILPVAGCQEVVGLFLENVGWPPDDDPTNPRSIVKLLEKAKGKPVEAKEDSDGLQRSWRHLGKPGTVDYANVISKSGNVIIEARVAGVIQCNVEETELSSVQVSGEGKRAAMSVGCGCFAEHSEGPLCSNQPALGGAYWKYAAEPHNSAITKERAAEIAQKRALSLLGSQVEVGDVCECSASRRR